MKLILFSDLHLDASYTWLPPKAARRRRQNLRETLRNIAHFAQEEEPDAILCGGDLYEHQQVTPDTGEFLRALLEDLHPVPVYIAPGNHDWYGPESLYHRLQWSPNVHIFREDRLRPISLEDGLTLWGAAHRAPANTDNFLTGFHVSEAGTHVALFHGSERAWFVEQETGKQPHAPFDEPEIAAAKLRHAFLGHFHTPKHTELFTYPGNPDPLTFGEVGARGAVVAHVDDSGAVHVTTRRVAVSEVHDLFMDISECVSQQDIRDLLQHQLAGVSGSVRVTLEGELAQQIDLPPRDLDSAAPQLDGLLVRVGEIRAGYDFGQIAQERTVRGQFVKDVLAANLEPDERRRILITGLRALDGRADLEVV